MAKRVGWALVTGASAGIGAQFARELARRGMALMLVARRGDRLRQLAGELGVPVRVMEADLTLDGDRCRVWEQVSEVGEGLELLVNNAGFGLLGNFHELDRERQLEMVRVNVLALTDLAHRFIGLRRDAGGGGALINVASVAGLRPLPFHAVYAATKAYVVSLSLALAEEVRPHGIRVQALCPGPVPTEFQEVAGVVLDGRSEKVVIQVDQVVRESLTALDRGRQLWIPGARLRTLVRIYRLLPAGLATWLGARTMRRRKA